MVKKKLLISWFVVLTLVFGSAVSGFALNETIVKLTETSIKETVSYFNTIQNSDGGFPIEKGRKSNLGITSWVLMGLGASGEKIESSKWTRSGKNPLDYMESCGIELEETTEFASVALALTAVGKEPIYGGENLVDKILSFQQSDGGFYQPALNETGMINTHMWSIFAIASSGKNIPNIKKTKTWLINKQNTDGGFGWVEGASSDTDDTGVAIQALVLLGENPKTSKVIEDALAFLKTYQVDDGGFSAGEWMGKESNTASDAWVLQGLIAAEQNPLDLKWIKNNKSVIDHLLSNQLADGSFNWKKDTSSSTAQMTAYALMALNQKPHPVGKVEIKDEVLFKDLSENYWAYWEIKSLVENGVISGYPDKTFLPEKNVTRAEFTRFLVYGLNKQELKYSQRLTFGDLSGNHWAYSLIGIGVNQNFISGRSSKVFDPNGKISGAELSSMLIRSMYKDYGTRVSKGVKWYSGYVKLSKENNLLYPGFDPDIQVTRAQCAYSISQLRRALDIK